MLSREDNELLCRIGPGTAMDELVRQYWARVEHRGLSRAVLGNLPAV